MTTKKNDKQKLSVINPDAAGIDIGSREHYVSYQLIEKKRTCENSPLLPVI